jgi:hypothetical protein
LKISYAQRKRLKSLATRYLHQYDNLVETKDINQHYLSDFNSFMEGMLVDICGYKKEEKPTIHRPRKVGQRPPRRATGERPPKIGEKISTKPKALAKHRSENPKKIPKISFPDDSSDKPGWYKKAWRKVMLSVHPDRLDLISKDDMDKLERIRIANRLSEDDSPHLLVASANQINVDINVSVHEQERILRVSAEKFKKELLELQQGIPWVWGESFTNLTLRMQVIKLVMESSGLTPPPDNNILEYLSREEN